MYGRGTSLVYNDGMEWGRQDRWLQLGGAFVRIWRPVTGLTVELPTAVVVDRDENVVWFGEKAATLEGKVPTEYRYVRPWQQDAIVDRTALRALLTAAHRLDARLSAASPWSLIRTHVLLPPTVNDLQRRWLSQTLREAGLWWLHTEDALQRAVADQSGAIALVVDAGFSTTRIAAYAHGSCLASRALPSVSLQGFCELLAREEERQHGVRFHPSQWYAQGWFTQQPALNEQATAVMAVVHRAVWQGVAQIMIDQLQVGVKEVWQSLPTAARTDIGRQGLFLIGGMASVEGMAALLEAALEIPVKASRKSVYASLRGS